jgi:hypothetical protein
MKHIFSTLLFSFILFSITSNAQLAGSTALKTNLSFRIGKNNNKISSNGTTTNLGYTQGFEVGLAPSIGKINVRNTFTYVGLRLGYLGGKGDNSTDISRNREYIIGIQGGKQKLIEFTPKVFFMPGVEAGFQFNSSSSEADNFPQYALNRKSYYAYLDFIPFAIGFQVKERIIGNFQVGDLSLYYTRSIEKRVNSGSNVKGIQSGVQFRFLPDQFKIGLIYLLKQPKS